VQARLRFQAKFRFMSGSAPAIPVIGWGTVKGARQIAKVPGWSRWAGRDGLLDRWLFLCPPSHNKKPFVPLIQCLQAFLAIFLLDSEYVPILELARKLLAFATRSVFFEFLKHLILSLQRVSIWKRSGRGHAIN
jgi:hypothetical protein